MSSPTTPGALLRGPATVMLAAALWGTVGIASKALFVSADVGALSVGFFRLLIAGPGLFAVAGLTLGRNGLRIARRDLAVLFLLGLSQAGYQGLYFGAVERLGVTLATLNALCAAPVLVAVLAVVFLKEQIDTVLTLSIVLAAAGVACLIGFPSSIEADPASFQLGILMASGAALSYAVFALCARQLAPRYHPCTLIGFGFSVGAITLLPPTVTAGQALPDSGQAWGLIAYVGLVATCAAYALFLHGMRTTPATVSGILVLGEPMTAAILAWLIFNETLGPLGLLGAILLCAAVVLLARPWRHT